MKEMIFLNGKKLQIIMGNITTLSADAIVNAANCSLLGGGGVDGAIHRAAGPELLQACIQLHGCKTGEAKITPGFNLPAKYVVHTPGPIWRGGVYNEPQLLANCYYNSLKLADQYFCKTVAFPSISTGVYRYPLSEAATIALESIKAYIGDSQEKKINISAVIMCCFDEKTLKIYETMLETLLKNKKR